MTSNRIITHIPADRGQAVQVLTDREQMLALAREFQVEIFGPVPTAASGR